jgi:hypothetical protein
MAISLMITVSDRETAADPQAPWLSQPLSSARDYSTTGQSGGKSAAARRAARPEHRSRRGSCFSDLSLRLPAVAKWPYTRSRTGHRPGSRVRVPGFSDGRCQDALRAEVRGLRLEVERSVARARVEADPGPGDGALNLSRSELVEAWGIGE